MTSKKLPVIINSGLNIGSDRVSFSASAEWSYPLSGVIVMDETSPSSNTPEIRHDIDENKNMGRTTCTVEPDKFIKINRGEANSSVDTYKSQYCYAGNYNYIDDPRSVSVNIF